jgi:tRNA C32,U32 (ribose-2'-O)-methylase TrmJ
MAKQYLDDAHVRPALQEWVANVCLKVCTVTGFLKPAAAQTERQAACTASPQQGQYRDTRSKTIVVTGRSVQGFCIGNSHRRRYLEMSPTPNAVASTAVAGAATVCEHALMRTISRCKHEFRRLFSHSVSKTSRDGTEQENSSGMSASTDHSMVHGRTLSL